MCGFISLGFCWSLTWFFFGLSLCVVYECVYFFHVGIEFNLSPFFVISSTSSSVYSVLNSVFFTHTKLYKHMKISRLFNEERPNKVYVQMRWERESDRRVKEQSEKIKCMDKKTPKCFESQWNHRERERKSQTHTNKKISPQHWFQSQSILNRRHIAVLHWFRVLYKWLANEIHAQATKFKISEFTPLFSSSSLFQHMRYAQDWMWSITCAARCMVYSACQHCIGMLTKHYFKAIIEVFCSRQNFSH